MASSLIPLDDLVANPAGIDFSIALAGDVFRMVIRYNEREGRYFMTLFDEDDVLLVSSVKVILDFPLLNRVTDPRRPKGEIFAVDKGAGEPTLSTLGDGVELVFTPFTDLV